MVYEIALKEHRKEVWAVSDKVLRRMKEVSPVSTDLQPGTTIFRLFWAASLNKFVTIPGASLYLVTKTGNIELIEN